ncbi:hypothetical protein AAFF_G00025980 [Aldrovandia affinis]|uniref:Uncharacterized protein n=1 Tax=Aldrovandia affinis TaxID=143900 RepID=A0AAD7S738_9TELE|nr:hypothetical protein AAFF_G00025980 [Aldrovandia affinis]
MIGEQAQMALENQGETAHKSYSRTLLLKHPVLTELLPGVAVSSSIFQFIPATDQNRARLRHVHKLNALLEGLPSKKKGIFLPYQRKTSRDNCEPWESADKQPFHASSIRDSPSLPQQTRQQQPRWPNRICRSAGRVSMRRMPQWQMCHILLLWG